MVIENSTLLTVSESASSKFKEVLAEQDASEGLIRISLTPGAAGGVEYILGLEEAPDENDTLIEAFGVKIVVDSESTPLLQGSNIDYVEGLQRSGFVISNPNFPSSGGCGGGGCACGGGGEEQAPQAEAGGCACGGGGCGAAEQQQAPEAVAGGCACGGGGCGGGGGHSH
ncbi:MAG: iron-sulfur cluster assembly accessory protein [Chloroflexi bacterium]|nr:iron-sulfur cluster assembly accessory protein [Chloroflexota bacterium]